jgi:hypothetical protein
LGKKTLLAGGILLAICATGAYILLNDKKNVARIKEVVAEKLGLLESP